MPTPSTTRRGASPAARSSTRPAQALARRLGEREAVAEAQGGEAERCGRRRRPPGCPTLPLPSGAVCSTAPVTSRPRGPRNDRSTAGHRAGGDPPAARDGGHRVHRRRPRRAWPSAQAGAAMPPVSTASTVRSPSASTPVARPCTARPSAKVTSVVRSRRLWAFVATRPSPTTTPQPRPPPRPMRTTAGATASATRPVVSWSRRLRLMVSPLVVCVVLGCIASH